MTTRSLVDPDWYLGTVAVVTADTVNVNLPLASAIGERRRLARGAVGDFVFIDCEQVKVLGRIVEVKVSDAERLRLEPKLGEATETHPTGRIQLLASVEQGSDRLSRGIKSYPRVGDNVYLAPGAVLSALLSASTASADELAINMGRLDIADRVGLKISIERLVGRHCGILGATGGGKSWTVAALIERIKEVGGKAIVVDPTGEFGTLTSIDAHYAFDTEEEGTSQVHFPYQEMTEDDLFVLLRPSGQTQGPKLREAIRSLKLVTATGGVRPANVIYRDGVVEKRRQLRVPFFAAVAAHDQALNNQLCRFDLRHLPSQISEECVWSTDRNDQTRWGDTENTQQSYCETLIARCRMLISAPELRCLFGTAGRSLVDVMTEFFASDAQDVMRISFRNVRFEHNTREVLLNIVGRYLLSVARAGQFKAQPLVVFLDEAHQFLGRTIGDEYASARLDAFGLIAKEGRKYGLTCVLATQRPRDVPEDVLSQIGTFIVHRLTNDGDRHVVERACGDLDRNAAAFIPTLSPGEAIIIGPDLPAPLPLAIDRPKKAPSSHGPDFKMAWTERLQRKQRQAQRPHRRPVAGPRRGQ